jgi:hypothetical protein
MCISCAFRVVVVFCVVNDRTETLRLLRKENIVYRKYVLKSFKPLQGIEYRYLMSSIVYV